MKNKIEFFEKNLKKLVKREMCLEEQNIDINVKVTGIESIPCLIDTCYQLVVIDGYFENLKTFWDTTNVEILVQKIKNKFEIENIQNYKFYFFNKDKNNIDIVVKNICSTKCFNYLIVER